MPIVTVGLGHRTAPVELREALTVGPTALPDALRTLSTLDAINEVVLLSTCNRLEIYAVTPDPARGLHAVEAFLHHRAGTRADELPVHLYALADVFSIRHLMEVAAGLDSLILGEPQILGQVGDALQAAQSAKTVGPVLHRLFGGAIRAGRRARAETAISRCTTSVSHAAVLLAEAHVDDLTQVKALVVGAGEMANLALKVLHSRGVAQIGCINRTLARAQERIRPFGGELFAWEELDRALVWADVVVTATGAADTVIRKHDVAAIHYRRQDRPLIFVDIALPRDVEEGVEALPDVHRFDIDHLRSVLDDGLAQRQAARPEVEAIIAAEIDEFVHWANSRQAIPAVVGLRRKVRSIAQDELDGALAQLSHLSHRDEEIIQRMVHRLVNKVLHEPTIGLKVAAAASPQRGQAYADTVRALFGVGE